MYRRYIMQIVSYVFLFVFFVAPSSVQATPVPMPDTKYVNVYSYRQPQLIKPLFDLFTARTGIEVHTLFAGKGLVERIAAEGKVSPVDVILTVDISRLMRAVQKGITQPVDSHNLKTNIPARFRSPDDHWFALSSRARVIYASRTRVAQEDITYAELANPKWKGKLCTRSGRHDYSLGLIAAMIAHDGLDKAEAWLRGVRKNLARKPSGNDRSQIKRIFAGECDIALGNTYYMGLMETEQKELEQIAWAKSVKILFPDTKGRGTHVNISGMAMGKYAPHPVSARRLMNFLSSANAQSIYAETNFEYPIREDVPVSDRVQNWGQMKSDRLPLSEIAKQHRAASEMVDRIGFDDGSN